MISNAIVIIVIAATHRFNIIVIAATHWLAALTVIAVIAATH